MCEKNPPLVDETDHLCDINLRKDPRGEAILLIVRTESPRDAALYNKEFYIYTYL